MKHLLGSLPPVVERVKLMRKGQAPNGSSEDNLVKMAQSQVGHSVLLSLLPCRHLDDAGKEAEGEVGGATRGVGGGGGGGWGYGGCFSMTSHSDRLHNKLLFGQVKGRRPPCCPRSSFNDVAVRDCRLRRITKPYKDAQNRLLWRDKTCLARP